MAADEYLRNILARERVDNGPFSPVRTVITTLQPNLTQWGNGDRISAQPSGSFPKGTANRSGTDIDVFVSSTTPDPLKQIHGTLVTKLAQVGYIPRQQNVSITITVNAYAVDVVPAKRQD
jgi:tRNA nucleotidyltransferase (CCA-adding enzyme)